MSNIPESRENGNEGDQGANKNYFRILSLDGGGVYGVFTALMLEQLCKKDENFLKNGCVNLFAGCSAGALISLLLAMHDDPRDAILEGKPQALLSDPMIYANLNPMNLMKSSVGLYPYFGTNEYYQVLKKYFGDLTLGDLKQKVMITTFNWAGSKQGRDPRKWKPKYYNNFRHADEDWGVKVADVAFSATSPSFYRAIWQGCQDGAWYTSNPTMCAIVEVIHEIFDAQVPADDVDGDFIPSPMAKLFLAALGDIPEAGKSEIFDRDTVLDNLSVLSMSTGDKTPFLPVDTVNWGMLPWMIGKWNTVLSQWVNPSLQSLQPPSEATNYQALQLLSRKYMAIDTKSGERIPSLREETGHDGYHRLAPEVLENPILLVTLRSRNNPRYLASVVKGIHEKAHSREAHEKLDEAVKWLENDKWFEPSYWMENAAKRNIEALTGKDKGKKDKEKKEKKDRGKK